MTAQPTPERPVAVIGAGMAGATAARALHDAAVPVRVFDKGRGVGGRLATRRHSKDGLSLQLDHGAPWFACDGAFGDACERMMAAGVLAPIHAGVTGVPAMSVVARHILADIAVEPSVDVETIESDPDGLTLAIKGGDRRGPFAAILVTVPAPQFGPLAGTRQPRFGEAAAAARYDPIWTGLFAFPDETAATVAALAHDALSGAGIETLIADGQKPGRSGAATLVAHASAAFSRDNLERERDDMAAEMTAALTRLGLPRPLYAKAHRWRFAKVAEAAPVDAAFDPATGLGVAGDWTRGPEVGDAWASGIRLAAEVVEWAGSED